MKRALGVVLVLLMCPASAQAGWKTDRAQAIAGVVFPAIPCGKPSVSYGDPARVYPASMLSKFSTPLAWAVKERCAVELNGVMAERWGLGWGQVCTLMIHEYGHLTGLGHSENPKSVMRANYDDGDPDPRCRKRGRPYLERHGLL